MTLTAKALLDEEPEPTEDQIRQALSGNLCRCTGHQAIVEAVQLAAKRLLAPGESSPAPVSDSLNS